MAVIRVFSALGVKTAKPLGLLDEQDYDSLDVDTNDDFAG